jgi:hypothetical protein
MACTGSCLCGAIRFRIDAELAPIQVCHCRQCRKAQGGPFATNIPVATTTFHWLSGEAQLQVYESSPGKQRVFCSRCGSPVLSRRDTQPSVLRVRAGLIDEPLAVRPAWHAYADSACTWWPITDDLPRHPGAAPASSRCK